MNFLRRLLALFGRPAPVPVPPPQPPPPGPPDTGLVAEINAARFRMNRTALTWHPGLASVAQRWAENMATTHLLTHGDSAGRIATVFPGRPSGETIAQGQADASGVVADWMASNGHRAILLGPYSLVGCGIARDGSGQAYSVADFVGS